MPGSQTILGCGGTPQSDLSWLSKGVAAVATVALAAGASLSLQSGAGAATITTSAAASGQTLVFTSDAVGTAAAGFLAAGQGGGSIPGAGTATIGTNADGIIRAGIQGAGTAAIAASASGQGTSNAAAAGTASISLYGRAGTPAWLTDLGLGGWPVPHFEKQDYLQTFVAGDGAGAISLAAAGGGGARVPGVGGALITLAAHGNSPVALTMLGPGGTPIPYFERVPVTAGNWTVEMSAVLAATSGPTEIKFVRDAFATLQATAKRMEARDGVATFGFVADGQMGERGQATIGFSAAGHSTPLTLGSGIGYATVAFGGVAVPPNQGAGAALIAFGANGAGGATDINLGAGTATITFSGAGGRLGTPVPNLSGETASSATLTWSAIPFATGYTLSVNGGAPVLAVSPFNLTGLTPGTPYVVTVVASAPGYTDSQPGVVAFQIITGATGGITVQSLDVTLSVSLTAFGKAVLGIGQSGYTLSSAFSRILPSGAGVGQVIKIFDSREANAGLARTLNAGTHDDIDLYGSLIDPLGNVLSFANVMAVFVKADDANTDNLIIGNGPTPFIGPFGAGSHTVSLGPKCSLLLEAPDPGWPVVDGATDLLRIANTGSAVLAYDLVVIGR